MRLRVLCLVSAAAVAVGCGDDGGIGGAGMGGAGGSAGQGGVDRSTGFSEIYEAGLTRFVGMNPPSNDPEPDAFGITRYEFSSEDRGPVCLRGGSYNVQARDGDSDELLIYLQGGGACWNALCSAEDDADAVPLLAFGILSTEAAETPTHDWDVLYLPYCDGSLFAGDADRMRIDPDTSEPIEMVYQRGLINLTAALDVASTRYPNPSRVMVAGISGGAFGTITATPLVRYYYPDVDILVFNDSGVGIAKDGEPEFVEGLLEEWNASDLIPESCSDCTSNGHITRFIEWGLTADPTLQVSLLSFTRDAVIAGSFLQIDPAGFETVLLSETERIVTNFPEQTRRFILPGTKHTVLQDAGMLVDSLGQLSDTANGVTVRDFLFGMVDGTEDWANQVDVGSP